MVLPSQLELPAVSALMLETRAGGDGALPPGRGLAWEVATLPSVVRSPMLCGLAVTLSKLLFIACDPQRLELGKSANQGTGGSCCPAVSVG